MILLQAILHEVAQERKVEIVELEVIPDHVHLLVEIDRQFGTHHLRQELPWLKNDCRLFGQTRTLFLQWEVPHFPSSSNTPKTKNV